MEFDDVMKRLDSQLSSISGGSGTRSTTGGCTQNTGGGGGKSFVHFDTTNITQSIKQFYTQHNAVFILFLIATLVVLLYFKPGFIQDEDPYTFQKKVSIKKLLFATTIITLLLVVCYFVYQYKRGE